jgi:hypothetical protein
MFAVDREERLPLAASLGGDELSGDQAFFVGKADGFARADRFIGSF